MKDHHEIETDADILNLEALLERDPVTYAHNSSFWLDDGFYSRLDGQKGDMPDYMHFDEDDEALLEFYNLDEAERLARVDQHGPSSYFSEEDQVSRLSHVTGTMLLARKFDQSIETQIASLCHDFHPPFSHKGEMALGEDTEYHENRMDEVLGGEFGNTIQKYGLNPEEILERSNHEILWNDRPKLSLDRTDYLLRDALVKGSGRRKSEPINKVGERYGLPNILEEPNLNSISVEMVLDDLSLSNNGKELELKSEQSVKMIRRADEMLRDNVYFCDERNIVDSFIAGEIRKLVGSGSILHEDFFSMDDRQVFERLISSKQTELPITSQIGSPEEILQLEKWGEEHDEISKLQNKDENSKSAIRPTVNS